MTSELKPCPFCGAKMPNSDDDDIGYPFGRSKTLVIPCQSCGGVMTCNTVEEGIELWNTRKSIPIAELEAFIEDNKDEYLSSDDIIGFSIEVYELQALIDKYKL